MAGPFEHGGRDFGEPKDVVPFGDSRRILLQQQYSCRAGAGFSVWAENASTRERFCYRGERCHRTRLQPACKSFETVRLWTDPLGFAIAICAISVYVARRLRKLQTGPPLLPMLVEGQSFIEP